ncbi:hypothetical protein [Spiroplasma sp. DGKH1]|uniref:hypothetical protein n=1 Tax=Spiroplasma sp. DGKH1 TaxID=3050074 RepID=UPI0034C659CC
MWRKHKWLLIIASSLTAIILILSLGLGLYFGLAAKQHQSHNSSPSLDEINNPQYQLLHQFNNRIVNFKKDYQNNLYVLLGDHELWKITPTGEVILLIKKINIITSTYPILQFDIRGNWYLVDDCQMWTGNGKANDIQELFSFAKNPQDKLDLQITAFNVNPMGEWIAAVNVKDTTTTDLWQGLANHSPVQIVNKTPGIITMLQFDHQNNIFMVNKQTIYQFNRTLKTLDPVYMNPVDIIEINFDHQNNWYIYDVQSTVQIGHQAGMLIPDHFYQLPPPFLVATTRDLVSELRHQFLLLYLNWNFDQANHWAMRIQNSIVVGDINGIIGYYHLKLFPNYVGDGANNIHKIIFWIFYFLDEQHLQLVTYYKAFIIDLTAAQKYPTPEPNGYFLIFENKTANLFTSDFENKL